MVGFRFLLIYFYLITQDAQNPGAKS